jgi:hypothetical protein
MAGGAGVTIYVYPLKGQRPIAPIRYAEPLWYGMTADSEEELHPFAETIGLYRHFYRPPDSGVSPGIGHYDLDQAERDRAIAGGARRITRRKLARLLRQRAAGKPS